MNEVIERCNWLVNKCDDKAITPDVKDDIGYLLEEIERLNNIINKAIEYIKTVQESEKDLNPYRLHAPTLLNILQGSDKE